MRNPRRRSNAILAALWINAAALVILILILLTRSNTPGILPAAMAQNQPPIAGGAGVFVMPCQLSTNTWGCYLMDVDAQTLCVYQFYPADKLLKLMAARNFRYDRKLANFNTQPAPSEVADLLEREKKAAHDATPEKPKQD